MDLDPSKYVPKPVSHNIMGYATHLSVPPLPIIGIKKPAEKRKKREITPKPIDIYLNGASRIFEEVMAAIPPEINVVKAKTRCNTATFPGNNPTPNTPRPKSPKVILKISFL